MKRLVYIFIPILAVLLMSHNTFAFGNAWMPYTCYDIQGVGITCGQNTVFTGDMITVLSVAKSNNANLSSAGTGQDFLWAFNVRAYGSNAVFSINLANGWPDMASIDSIEQFCNTSNNITSCNVLVVGTLMAQNWNVQLAGQINAFGVQYEIASLYFSTDWSTDYNIHSRLLEIRNYLQNNPQPTAQDIADAIENTAEQNTQNAANDSQTAGSSSSQDATTATSSLISAIGGFVGAVTSASPTNCVVNFTTSQLTIGNMDLCANPVPAYVQIIGSIILICAAIPLAIVLFNRFIGLFRSFQG